MNNNEKKLNIKIMIIKITILIDKLIVKETKLKSNTSENGPEKLSEKTVQKDRKMENGKMKLKVREHLQKL